MHRRDFLKASLASAATMSAAASAPAQAATPTSAGSAPAPLAAIDTNVHLFHWPFRRLPLDATAAMLARMTEHGIAQAWAASFEGILHRDLAGVNARLAEECRAHGDRFVPFGTVNPALPGWEEDVRRCHEVHRMPGVRLYPNYHGYTLADERVRRLLTTASERGLLVQIAMLLEDTRTQHPILNVPDVDAAPLPGLAAALPRLRLQLLNSGKVLDGALAARLTAVPNIHFDIARVETAGGVGRHLRKLPPGRLVFGTHAPFFIYESALIKLYESSLTEAETRALLVDNPRRLLAPA